MANLKKRRGCRRKKAILFLLIYFAITLFCLSYISSDLFPKEENCNLQSVADIQKESNLSKEIENNINSFLSVYENNITQIKRWIEITKDVYIYSAYLDKCPSTFSLPVPLCIKFVGIVLSDTSDHISRSNLQCAFEIKTSMYKGGFAVIERLPEDHDKKYTAAFFYCELEKLPQNFLLPEYATLYESPHETPWLPVQHLPFNNVTSFTTISLCVRPLYDSFSAVQLSVFLAYYSTMGVDHFILYQHNLSELLQKFLASLMDNNISIELHSWDIPLDNMIIHEYGQMVFTQDCISRSKYRFSHTVIVDLDEFIVPKMHNSITDLVQYLDAENQDAASYVIPMVLFCDEFSFLKSKLSPFHIFNRNTRQKTLWEYWYRSKYILKPEKVHYGGIHFIWEYENNGQEIFVPGSLALLHHYRQCCGVQQTWFFHLFTFYVLNDETVVDNSLCNYESEVTNHSFIRFILNPF